MDYNECRATEVTEVTLPSGAMDKKLAISTYHLQQHELVNFLYDRFPLGMFYTLAVGFIAALLAAFELDLQGRSTWAWLWYGGLVILELARWRLKLLYDRVRHDDYLNHRLWKRRFFAGMTVVALWQGLGAVIVMPYISQNLQYIYLLFLLSLGAGAIAYLSTSMSVYISYLIFMILPSTMYLFWLGTPDGIVLGVMYLFMLWAYYSGVRCMNRMIADSLTYRFDNELLVNDLQRLLNAVARSNKELDKISTTDELTGASNFRAFRVRLEEFRRKHASNKLPLSIVMVNIDHFYEYNVAYGQDIGNRTLTQVAHLLMAEVVNGDEIVARLHGAEFGLLLPGISCEGARMMMQKIMDQLAELKIEHKGAKSFDRLTLSIGICCTPINDELSSRDLLQRAESALLLAKRNGRNRIEIAA